jgi:putative membrane protein
MEGKGDLRDYLAAETTYLAWIRTGLALMGFGFVVARFGLFLAEFQRIQGASVAGASVVGSLAAPSHGFSLASGIMLIAAGIGVNVYAAWSHARLVGALNRGEVTVPRSPKVAVLVGLFLALAGAAMAVYLTLIRES